MELRFDTIDECIEKDQTHAYVNIVSSSSVSGQCQTTIETNNRLSKSIEKTSVLCSCTKLRRMKKFQIINLEHLSLMADKYS
jgi:hypothetical protein